MRIVTDKIFVEPVDAVIVIVPLRVRPGIGCVAAWLTLQEYIFEKTMEIGEKAWTMRAACQEREWSQYFECTSVGRRGSAWGCLMRRHD